MVFQRVAQAEQKKQQRPFGPFTQRRSAARSYQHQEVDLETTRAQAADGLAQREVTAKRVGVDIQRRWHPGRADAALPKRPAEIEQRAVNQRKSHLGFFTEGAAVRVVVTLMAFMGCVTFVVSGAGGCGRCRLRGVVMVSSLALSINIAHWIDKAHSRVGKPVLQCLLGNPLAVELNADDTGRCYVGFKHPVPSPDLRGQAARGAGVEGVHCLQQKVARLFGQLRTNAQRQLAHTGQ